MHGSPHGKEEEMEIYSGSGSGSHQAREMVSWLVRRLQMIVEMNLQVVEMEMEVEPPSSCLSQVLVLTSRQHYWQHWYTSSSVA